MAVLCVNLCELDWPRLIGAVERPVAAPPLFQSMDALVGVVCTEGNLPHCERLYLGSSFCVNAFLAAANDEALRAVQRFCATWQVPCTLTIPVATQSELAAVKAAVKRALAACPAIDELTVNDYGMLEWAAEHTGAALNLGRLFSRDLRDPRYAGGFPQVYRPGLLPETLERVMGLYPQVQGAEFDPAGCVVDLSALPAGAAAAVHVPYLFATTGKYCSYAAPRQDSVPSGPGSDCMMECRAAMTTYRLSSEPLAEGAKGEPLYYTKHGKTVYLLNDAVQVTGASDWRLVHAPRHFGWLLEGGAA